MLNKQHRKELALALNLSGTFLFLIFAFVSVTIDGKYFFGLFCLVMSIAGMVQLHKILETFEGDSNE